MVVLAAMVILLATGSVPPAVAGPARAGAMVLLGVLSIDRAFAAISWTTVVLVAGMIPLSTAMPTTGAAEHLPPARRPRGRLRPLALLIALFVLTAVLGQLISNMATALIVIPIAVRRGRTRPRRSRS